MSIPSLDSVTVGSTLRQTYHPPIRSVSGGFSALPTFNSHAGKVGSRRNGHVMMDSDIRGHKDSKNKALTVNLKAAHNPGSSGKHGTLNLGDHRKGVSAASLKNSRIKYRSSATAQTVSSGGGGPRDPTVHEFHSNAPVRSAHADHFGYGGLAEYGAEEPAMLAPNDVPTTSTTELGHARGLHYTLQGQDENDPSSRADKQNFMHSMSKP